MSPNWEHNEGRPATMRDVEDLLKQMDGESSENEPISALNQRDLMLAKNGGFPKPMYHATLEPVFAMSRKKEAALGEMGYKPYYIPRDFPKMLFRRNMSPRFEPKIDPGTKEVINIPYVEERIVKTAEAETKLRHEKNIVSIHFVGQWVEKIDEVDPMPEGPKEDPKVTIARLEGQLNGQHFEAPASPKRRGPNRRKVGQHFEAPASPKRRGPNRRKVQDAALSTSA